MPVYMTNEQAIHTQDTLLSTTDEYAPRRVDSKKIDLEDFMERNFRSDLSMTEFARAAGRSLSTFKRDFKQFSTLSPERWLTNRRLLAAHDLLRRGRRVSDVCFDVGFKNVSHFSAIFKRKFGQTPGQVRKAQPADTEDKD